MCAILGIIGYHIVMARRLKKTNHDYRLYLARNVVALSFYVFMTVVVLADGLGGNVHFHHYSAGVLLALWCELDTPTSVIGFAISLSLITQGLAAYGQDRNFKDKGSSSYGIPMDASNCKWFFGRSNMWGEASINFEPPAYWSDFTSEAFVPNEEYINYKGIQLEDMTNEALEEDPDIGEFRMLTAVMCFSDDEPFQPICGKELIREKTMGGFFNVAAPCAEDE
jgi:hypothetical protein